MNEVCLHVVAIELHIPIIEKAKDIVARFVNCVGSLLLNLAARLETNY
jgi:hypothetical protein